MLKALIVDDEPLAHQVIMHHLSVHPDICVSGHCYSAIETLSRLANNPIDLIFLDINMPELDGIEMLKVLANRPQVIIISAYQEYALAGFELDVTDYLLKPVSAERLSQALDKVRARDNTKILEESLPVAPESIVLKVDREKRKFQLHSITFFEAYGNYVKVWQQDKMTLVSCTLKHLLSELPSHIFVQIHKSFIINKEKVTIVTVDTVTLDNSTQVKIGKSFKTLAQNLL
ncbi:LytR/AlgR family response regulator transcription factor [Thalassotalea piscium]